MYNEERIERYIESATNRYDAALMAGRLDQKAYDYQMSELNKWADMQYRMIAAVKFSVAD